MNLAARILRTRAIVRAPLPLFERGLGWVLAGRFLMLEHTGRTSGLPRRVVLEVIGRPDDRTYRVVSGLGRRAQWFRNIVRHPSVRVSVGERRDVGAVTEVLSPEAGSAALAHYAREHPAVWRTLSGALEASVEPGDEGLASIPVVDIRLDPPVADPPVAPRNAWTRFVGPVSRDESAAILIPAALGAVAIGIRTGRRDGPVAGVVAGALGYDLIGGAVEFQTRTGRAHYAQKSERERLLFAALHLQPFVIPLIKQGGWPVAGVRYLLSLGANVLLPRVPADRRRVAGVAGAALATAADRLASGSAERWFGPAYLTKMIAGHATIGDPPR
jgi:deazaflavin-dependent oxidoreductase (nitroreductase family)